MNFQIDQLLLSKTLTKFASIYNDQADIEILECLYLEIINNELILKSTNLMCKMICNLKVGPSSEGKTVVNFQSLYGIVKNLPSTKLSFYIENNQLVIKTNNKKFHISTYPSDNYPEINIETEHKLNINSAKFSKLLSKVDKVFGKDFPVNHLCFVSSSDLIELVATNAARLSYCKLNNDTGTNFKILIDDKSLSILKGFLKTGEAFSFELGNRELIVYNDNVKLVVTFHRDFKFPPYEILLKIEYKYQISISKSELEESLKLLLSNLKDDKTVLLNINDNKLTITHKSAVFACEQIIDIKSNGEGIIKLSAEHLLETIKNVSEKEIIIKFNDKTTPIKIVSEDYIGLITLCNQ